MSRYDLTDFEWRVIAPLLPNNPRGVPRVDDRRVLNGIFWVLRSGAPWRDQAQDAPAALTLLDRLDPRTIVLADKAYGGNAIRNLIAGVAYLANLAKIHRQSCLPRAVVGVKQDAFFVAARRVEHFSDMCGERWQIAKGRRSRNELCDCVVLASIA